ncbi:MAG TPA: TIGR03619 family F420-dependent LLM class oxidoreductase [Solirubrobacteraceae bacterium]|nr:TIGR03619 family F420-dependent LLM class oxidoreductase [Solirubrobacteraceae bacterium]
MRFSVFHFPSSDAIDIAELAVAVEDAGFTSLLFAEHTHVPLVGSDAHPGGGPIPDFYASLLDPVVAMTVAAAATRRLQVGTSICIVPPRDPIILAKQIASIEHATTTRIVFGVGVGWNRKEIANHGIDPVRRWELMREHIISMKELWTRPAAEFHGDNVDFDLLRQEPKPLHEPHPPILIGGNGRRAIEAVLEYGDGWIPSFALGEVPLATRVSRLRERAAALGRPDPHVAVTSVPADHESIERCAAADVDEVVFRLPAERRDVVLETVGRLSALVAGFR